MTRRTRYSSVDFDGEGKRVNVKASERSAGAVLLLELERSNDE
jgi:hypothetical protein